MNSLFGTFNQRKFSDVYSDAESFLTDWKSTAFYESGLITDAHINVIFYSLYARYANSIIASTDENRFSYNLFYLIYCYGPTWEKKLDIQKNLRNISDNDLVTGTRAIYNHANHPQTAPGTDTTESLGYIDAQDTTGYKKSKMDAYTQLYQLLEDDVTEGFIDKFKKLFLTVVSPQEPLIYESED